MSEKSGIQMIEELLSGQVVLDRRVQVVEQLLKQLLALANTSCPAPNLEMNGRPVREGVELNGRPVQAKPSIEGMAQEPLIRAAANARVVGKIMDGGKPIPEVNVTIHDDKDNVVKRTRTNRSGEWMAQLPPGKYAAECLLEGRVNGNVVFQIGQNDKIVRVGQPQ